MWKRGISQVRHNNAGSQIRYPYDGRTYYYLDGCESNTECYLYNYHDPASVHPANSTCQLDPPYQNTLMELPCMFRTDGLGYVGDNNGSTFMTKGWRNMALYLRSGAASASMHSAA